MDSPFDTSEAEAAAALWAQRSAPVLRGLAHALGNRLHALALVRDAIALGEVLDSEQAALVGEELDTVQALTDRMRLLAFTTDEDLLPARVVELAPDAIALHGAHLDVVAAQLVVEVDGEPPAALLPPRAFTQALLLLLLDASADGATPRLVVAGSPEEIAVTVMGSPPAGATRAAVLWMLRGVIGPVALDLRADGVRLTAPSLAVSRRLEREASPPD